ncbi:hypothetical protein HCN44_003178 [Aphidius gifuensis]|uniref:Caprin-1 dimerization domain-containing protein n=1 Tax=Aphidius gifuensis TaxID=684658 RepID=A0A834XI95_APHGI|nr:caprin homolog [Aphidius gifuensis]KAF7987416.1 hypothetical protein HCN44_003178 [Aphidius gifuensis]
MPSANPKLEKQASTEANDPIRQAIIVIEHKIRNLEKRKGKLESYRDIQKTGKELDRDQKIAVAKYDEVLQTLEITRDLYKQIVGIANDAAKLQKKLARKEAAERIQHDISKVREVLIIQDTLMNMSGERLRKNFLEGTNGANLMTEEDFKLLDDMYKELTLERLPGSVESTFLQRVQKTAEHYVALVDGKQRDVVGSTYAKIRTIIQDINKSEYLDRERVSETPEAQEEEIDKRTTEFNSQLAQEQEYLEQQTGEVNNIPSQETMIPNTNFVAPVVADTETPVAAIIPVIQQQNTNTIEVTYYLPEPPQHQTQPPRIINDAIGGTPNFFFLQESELDSSDLSNQQSVHIPPTAEALAIQTQTYINQGYSNVPLRVSPSQMIFTHPLPTQEITPHIPGFANPNPPPPIPMPPSHQQNDLQLSPQQSGYEQQQQVQPQTTEQEQAESRQDEQVTNVNETERTTESNDWSQMGDSNEIDEWVNIDLQTSGGYQGWGVQHTGGYRGRGGRRGNNTNGYGGRGGNRGGSYQQNGRNGQGGSYYRNENSNYQNGGSSGGSGGYQQRNYNNNDGGYNGGFKRERGGGSRGAPRGTGGERSNNMDRGTRGGQYRGQRGGNRGGNTAGGGYVPRSKPQAQQ